MMTATRRYMFTFQGIAEDGRLEIGNYPVQTDKALTLDLCSECRKKWAKDASVDPERVVLLSVIHLEG